MSVKLPNASNSMNTTVSSVYFEPNFVKLLIKLCLASFIASASNAFIRI